MMRPASLRNVALLATLGVLGLWLAAFVESISLRALPAGLHVAALALAVALLAAWMRWARHEPTPTRALIASMLYGVLWDAAVLGADSLGWNTVRANLGHYGLGGLFIIGLMWVVWWLELASRHYRALRVAAAPAAPRGDGQRAATRIALDVDAWYFGGEGRKLNQSLAALATYGLLFLCVSLAFSQLQGCKETYEMPAGGGQNKMVAQAVRVQKVVKKRYVINPFSLIKFDVPPIDEVKLQLAEATAHLYKVGFGEGDGAGFAGGTRKGEVRFIRLEYSGGDWDQDFGLGGDVNLLNEYGARTGQKIASKTESRAIAQLANFPAGKSPPLVYLTGQRNITLSKSEVATLRSYLLEKHGMLFGDNGGSPHFHSQFFAMMRQVLPNVEPVRVPLDDVIHRQPYAIPFLPYVAPHGGKDAWGWKVDGRWVCYYHPGDIGDAWSDDHAGVTREVWEACYQLGTNVIFYAHAEYAKWLQARQKR